MSNGKDIGAGLAFKWRCAARCCLPSRHPAAISVPNDTARSVRSTLHSSRFVLVDRQARVRGYYDSRDVAALQRLRRDMSALLHGNA